MNQEQFNTELASVRSRIDEHLAITERLAGEVMGWHLFTEDADEWLDADSKHAAPRTWHPLMDIEAALSVVRRLNDLRGWRFGLVQDWHGNWMASIFHKDSRIADSAWAPPDNLPEAISDATIKALSSS